MAEFFRKRIEGAKLATLAVGLGVSAESLCLLKIGQITETQWSFPMCDGRGEIVGIRTRSDRGAKRAIAGSRSGLFVPDRWLDDGPIYVCEGPTDCAALLTLGLNAVGRASCNEGGRELLAMRNGRSYVIVADNDKVGIDGARRLAALLGGAPMIRPPDGFKDVRAWVNAKATRADVEAGQ
jgi:hypothetical protein